MSELSLQEKVVIDNGSGFLKSGFAGEDAPRSSFPTILGWPRHPGVGGLMLGAKKDDYVGQHAQEQRGLLAIRRPIVRGKIMNWDDMEKIWHHALYSELVVAPEEHPLLMTDIPTAEKLEKERMATMLFETFNVPAVYICNQSVASLFATGRTTGVVLDSGEGQTHCSPVWEGYSMPHHVVSFPLAGMDLTSNLIDSFRNEGYPFSTALDRDIVQHVKETLCYVCMNYEEESEQCTLKQSYEKEYSLPDGSSLILAKTRFHIPELLFRPELAGLPADTPSLSKVIWDCVMKCDSDVKKNLFLNIVLAGGNTLFPKLDERLHRELTLMSQKGTVVKVIAFPERQFGAWLGGSLLASLPTFPCMWISKLEFDEYGVNILHRKC